MTCHWSPVFQLSGLLLPVGFHLNFYRSVCGAVCVKRTYPLTYWRPAFSLSDNAAWQSLQHSEEDFSFSLLWYANMQSATLNNNNFSVLLERPQRNWCIVLAIKLFNCSIPYKSIKNASDFTGFCFLEIFKWVQIQLISYGKKNLFSFILSTALHIIWPRMLGVKVISSLSFCWPCFAALCRWKPPLVLYFFPHSRHTISWDWTCKS